MMISLMSARKITVLTTLAMVRPASARIALRFAKMCIRDRDQLLVKAEAFAIRAGGRSPRVAKQLIEQCEAGVQK